MVDYSRKCPIILIIIIIIVQWLLLFPKMSNYFPMIIIPKILLDIIIPKIWWWIIPENVQWYSGIIFIGSAMSNIIIADKNYRSLSNVPTKIKDKPL